MSRRSFYYIYTSKEKIMLKKIFKIIGFYSSFNHYFICCLYFSGPDQSKNCRGPMPKKVDARFPLQRLI
jgi:hypothetical protein